MNMLRKISQAWFVAMAAVLLLAGTPAQAAGTFRFLTTAVPDGTTNGQYFTKLLTANGAGQVQFSVKTGCGAQCDLLPAGLSLDPFTGAITGQPTTVNGGGVSVTFLADDGSTTIELYIDKFKITASGGGGNGGASFGMSAMPDARVGVPYSQTLTPSGGVGPFTYGAQDLPAGITIDGITGMVSGIPTVSGTFYVTFTVHDAGEDNSVITTLPITVYPADPGATYNFKFDTYMLDNGEVGTAYSDAYAVTDEDGTVTYNATGLPPGLTLDSATGVVSGTPTVAGTFYVTVTATDSGTGSTIISLNLPMWIAPHAGSDFYWNFFGVPAAFYGADYHRVPPLLINALNGVTVTYSATGLPPGIIYDSSTGELSGVSSEPGIYPVTFTATDTTTGEVLTLSFDFIVLPPGGGDVNRLAVNLWIKKLTAKVKTDASTAPNDSWQAQYIYNADRRSGVNHVFDPMTQSMVMALADSTGTVAPMYFKQSKSGVFSYKTAKGLLPALQVKGTPSSQTLSVKVSSTELGFTLFPADMVVNTITLGNRGYKLKTYLDSKGKFVVTSSYRSASFVASAAKVKDVGKASDNISLSMYLADPSLLADYTFLQCDKTNKNCNQPTVKLKLYSGADVLLEKDLTALVASARVLDKNSMPVYKMKKVVKKDPSVGNNLTRFGFDSKKGRLIVSLKDLVLANPGLDPWQSHVGVELQIGSASYFTSVSLFESKNGSKTYSSRISKYASPFP